LAPGNASVDASHRIAQSAAGLIEDGLLDESGIDGVANRIGITSRHLRRVFQDEFGVAPIEFAQTQRLLLAKRLLTDTALPVTEVAFAAGFNSLRRFDALFKERYRLSPQQLRKTPRNEPRPDSLIFELSYRPPYDWKSLVAFLGARTIAGVESVDQSSYRRIVRIAQKGQTHNGWIEVRPDPRKNTMRVIASASLVKAIQPLLSRVKCLFDLSSNPAQIGERLGELANSRPGLRVPGAFDGFEIAIRAVLGQQVSVAAARTLAGRFAAAFGTAVESPFESLSTAFPGPERIANLDAEEIVRLGILRSRAEAIMELAKAVADGVIALTPGADVDETSRKLSTLPGIGEWTAQYIAMRALAWPDAFPHTDLGVRRAMGMKKPKEVLAAAEAWRPWRAYAVMHLWSGGGANGTVR
jgi:AraC family transcriptional regulator of adaptative response / DNA-3-methyladenine glycosylase II